MKSMVGEILTVVDEKIEFENRDEQKSKNVFFKFSHYRDYDSRTRNIGFSMKMTSTNVRFLIEILMVEIKQTVIEK